MRRSRRRSLCQRFGRSAHPRFVRNWRRRRSERSIARSRTRWSSCRWFAGAWIRTRGARERARGVGVELAAHDREGGRRSGSRSQLHSHVLIHGALRSDGKVVAVESRAWLVHQREIGATIARSSRVSCVVSGSWSCTGRVAATATSSWWCAGWLRERWSSRHHQVAGAIEQRLAEKKQALVAVIDQVVRTRRMRRSVLTVWSGAAG